MHHKGHAKCVSNGFQVAVDFLYGQVRVGFSTTILNTEGRFASFVGFLPFKVVGTFPASTDEGIVHDRRDPTFEVTAGLVAIAFAVSAQDGFLHQIFCVFVVLGQFAGKGFE